MGHSKKIYFLNVFQRSSDNWMDFCHLYLKGIPRGNTFVQQIQLKFPNKATITNSNDGTKWC